MLSLMERGCSVVLFYLFAVAFISVNAHGDGVTAEAHSHVHMPSNKTVKNETVYPPTYFAHKEYAGTIYAHIIAMVLAWVFILPVAVMLSIAQSRYTLIIQAVFLASNTVGVILAIIYNAKTPDLYPNNAHHKVGWIITWIVSAHVLLHLVGRIAGARKMKSNHEKEYSPEQQPFLPDSNQDSSSSTLSHDYHNPNTRSSADSASGSGSESPFFRRNSISTFFTDEGYPCDAGQKSYTGEVEFENMPVLSSTPPSSTMATKLTSVTAPRVWGYFGIVYRSVDRLILPFGFIALATGIVTFARFFEGHGIFGGLAHWIKGGVFFWLGLFNLGRWSGSFAELGWAWNLRPRYSKSHQRKFLPSAELMESILILFYGSTNIFLEHLGGWGGEWTAQDLEHMAITVLFIGGGLCGILIESSVIRTLLNTTTVIPISLQQDEEHKEHQVPDTYEFSLNPLPALVILLLGIMMSSHHQSTETATMVHKQWGALLLWASVARGLTYVLFYLRPPVSVFPSRPPTEILTSFGLISGGIIFMASSSDTVEGMIHYDLDAMFLYTITMGLVGMLMSWEITVLAIKGWAVRREQSVGHYSLVA